MTNDHRWTASRTFVRVSEGRHPVARVSIEVVLMAETAKEKEENRTGKKKGKERWTIKDHEQTGTHWKSALGQDTSNAGFTVRIRVGGY